jgi:hypothetical protein
MPEVGRSRSQRSAKDKATALAFEKQFVLEEEASCNRQRKRARAGGASSQESSAPHVGAPTPTKIKKVAKRVKEPGVAEGGARCAESSGPETVAAGSPLLEAAPAPVASTPSKGKGKRGAGKGASDSKGTKSSAPAQSARSAKEVKKEVKSTKVSKRTAKTRATGIPQASVAPLVPNPVEGTGATAHQSASNPIDETAPLALWACLDHCGTPAGVVTGIAVGIIVTGGRDVPVIAVCLTGSIIVWSHDSADRWACQARWKCAEHEAKCTGVEFWPCEPHHCKIRLAAAVEYTDATHLHEISAEIDFGRSSPSTCISELKSPPLPQPSVGTGCLAVFRSELSTSCQPGVVWGDCSQVVRWLPNATGPQGIARLPLPAILQPGVFVQHVCPVP